MTTGPADPGHSNSGSAGPRRTLLVLRHAKAVHTLGLADFDRPLTDRGRRDAVATGGRLRERRLLPDRVLCSTAKRTRETLDGLRLDAEASFERGIYDNDVNTLLDLIRLTDDAASTLLVLGHNPALHQLVFDLAGQGPDDFPTCALAVLELDGGWAAVAPGAGRLTEVWTPARS